MKWNEITKAKSFRPKSWLLNYHEVTICRKREQENIIYNIIVKEF